MGGGVVAFTFAAVLRKVGQELTTVHAQKFIYIHSSSFFLFFFFLFFFFLGGGGTLFYFPSFSRAF